MNTSMLWQDAASEIEKYLRRRGYETIKWPANMGDRLESGQQVSGPAYKKVNGKCHEAWFLIAPHNGLFKWFVNRIGG